MITMAICWHSFYPFRCMGQGNPVANTLFCRYPCILKVEVVCICFPCPTTEVLLHVNPDVYCISDGRSILYATTAHLKRKKRFKHIIKGFADPRSDARVAFCPWTNRTLLKYTGNSAELIHHRATIFYLDYIWSRVLFMCWISTGVFYCLNAVVEVWA